MGVALSLAVVAEESLPPSTLFRPSRSPGLLSHATRGGESSARSALVGFSCGWVRSSLTWGEKEDLRSSIDLGEPSTAPDESASAESTKRSFAAE